MKVLLKIKQEICNLFTMCLFITQTYNCYDKSFAKN